MVLFTALLRFSDQGIILRIALLAIGTTSLQPEAYSLEADFETVG